MKRIQGFICGFLAAIVLLVSVPALAASIDVIFNPLNIVINGVKAANKGENYTLVNGNEVPFSIVYKGTTYLPLRKISELMGKDLTLDSTTDTVHLNDPVITYNPKEEFPIKEENIMSENAITRKQLARWLVQSLELTENAYEDKITDVPIDNEYYNDIALAMGNGLMSYTNAYNEFEPNGVVMREDLRVLFQLPRKVMGDDFVPPYKIPDLVDYVDSGYLYCVFTMINLDLIDLYPDGTFRPYEPLIMSLTPNKNLQNYLQK